MNSLKKIIGNLLGFLLILFFKKSALKKLSSSVVPIYFHEPTEFLFESVIQFLHQNSFRFINEDEYYEIICKNKKLKEELAFISLDDGWKGNLNLIHILEKYQVPITIFVAVESVITGNFWWQYIDFLKLRYSQIVSDEDLKRMSNKERMSLVEEASAKIHLKRSAINLKELKLLHQHPLISIGSHTYHHPITVKCTDKELAFEYSESKKTLEKWLNREIKSLSYPNGDYDERDIAFLKENNYKMGFTTNHHIKKEGVNVYEIPRVPMNSKGGKYENISRALGLWYLYIQPLQRLNVSKSKIKQGNKSKFTCQVSK